jgi:predicted DNA-binding protein (MmcQ/YjbR family)
MDGSVADELIREWIEDSYDLVVAGLPRAVRASLTRREA